MERRTRVEPIEEFFFASPIWDEEGNIIPAPPEALAKYEELRSWLNSAPGSSSEVPGIALYPVYKNEKVGYVVATQIIYKQKTY